MKVPKMNRFAFAAVGLTGAFFIIIGAVFCALHLKPFDSGDANIIQSSPPDSVFTLTVKSEAAPPSQMIADAPRKSYSATHQRPPQKKTRRRKIKFPDDCNDDVPAGEKIKYLPTACAEALRSARTDLLKAAEEGGCSYPIDDEDNRSYPVAEDYKILTYTIKNANETNISVITRKLGTVIENIIENNKLHYPIEFSVGQELKYQKAHYEYSFEPVFHQFSSNRYLVEMRCWTAAYNLSNVYLLYDESAIPASVRVLEFPYLKFDYRNDLNDYDEKNDVPDSIEKVKVKSVGGRYFNPKTKELVVFVKAHGIGDAGRYARYSFPHGKPKLEEFRARIIWSGRGYGTDEVIKSPPKTWKRYYPK